MKQSNTKFTAIYCRVANTCNSAFLSQSQHLMEYAKEQGFKNIVLFGDNGFSGTRLNRPAYLGLISEIHSGNIERVIVKSIDRIGRDYSLTKDFLDLCEVCNVKLVSLDGSIEMYLDDDFAPLIHLFDEYQNLGKAGV